MSARPGQTAAWAALALLLAVVAFGIQGKASSETEPDISDAAGDQLLFGVEPACAEGVCVTGGGIDLLAAWIGNETATQLEVHIRTTSPEHESGAPGTPASLGVDTFTVGFTLDGTSYAGSVGVGSEGVEGMALPVTTVTARGNLIDLVLSRAALGGPATGAVLEGIHVLASRDDPSLPMPLVNDRAPESGAASVDYTFTLDSGPATPATGTASSTTVPNATVTSTSQGASTSPGASTSAGASPTSSQTSAGQSSPSDGGSAPRERLTPDPGYLMMSVAGFFAALAVCIIGLVRWSR